MPIKTATGQRGIQRQIKRLQRLFRAPIRPEKTFLNIYAKSA
jgi:hypothetical protein